jgi:type IV secretory pathway TrbF-like protein/sugar phosphate permease
VLPAAAPSGEHPAQTWRLIALVFLPFAAGYYLSYLFRTINALISGQLTSDLALGAADLGLLTSVYFLTLAALQVPIGVWLDRYGPRRVQSVLMLVAAAGAALFGAADGLVTLIFARLLIGLGVAAALMAGLKAIVLWFPRERVALINGCMVMLGALGAVTATAPAELLLQWTGWRGMFELLAAATAASAALIYFVVPERVVTASTPHGSTTVNLKAIYGDPRFWRLAPLSATCVGTAWALQGLWAAPWLTDVDRFDRAHVIRHLFVMAVALSAGALLLGTMADRLRRHGVGPRTILAVVATLFIAAQLALLARLPLPSYLLWSVVAAVGAAPVLSYTILAEFFPKEATGRANGALNVFHHGGAFVLQYATGLIIARWTSQAGHYPAIAYQVAFGLILALQMLALGWFVLPRVRTLGLDFFRALRRNSMPARSSRELITPYQKAAKAWAEQLGSVRAQTVNWRLAALGSTSVCALLGLACAISAGRASITPYIVETARLDGTRALDASTAGDAPSDAQIAFFLARFVRNVRSLSVDSIVVRASWMDALNYVTARGARSLNDYARDANPFDKIGVRPITVEIVYIVRASSDSFEIRWKEQTYENGGILKTDRFTAVVNVLFRPPNTTETISKNPLGLYIDTFNWWRDSVGADMK